MILGIDPGYGRTGYAFVASDGSAYTLGDAGLIETAATMPFAERLTVLFDAVTAVLEKRRPRAAAIERLFFSSNVKTAIDVAQARGVILLALARADVPVFEYTPSAVKSSVTGSGRAGKASMMRMLSIMMPRTAFPQDDVADAAAVAITHIHHRHIHERIQR